MEKTTYVAKYSGLGRSGICKCGHKWNEHHLCVVARQEYIDATGEYYLPCECEHYGFNEKGGMMPGEDGFWVQHCSHYEDKE